ncbi:Hypothetical protein NCS54_01198500 [Fusarium falciforme]|uniref:Hypothetical protein n=1 Tax=Fusarium falciforme TaxID=195108 RepID=UPI0022FFD1DA|nr:Hypothetical protein NCS54_01198500 [Fusarium falciforme]WAO94403.1 Hypothetical protein NCS54_01198500 [Fusarium falciforme]
MAAYVAVVKDLYQIVPLRRSSLLAFRCLLLIRTILPIVTQQEPYAGFDTEFPKCVTILMSSRANRDTTYSIFNCYSMDLKETYFLQDYPPYVSTTDTETSTTTTTIPPPPPPPSPPKSTPVGAIVGGVVGGLAVIALLVIGIFFYRRKKHTDGPEVEQTNLPTAQPPNQPGLASQPVYNAQTSHTAWSPTSPDPNLPMYNPAGGQYQITPSTSPRSEGFRSIPGGQEPKEVPATSPVGMGDNRAELT